jgi:putative nucleotidyltransferase with HDIG domain
MEKKNEIVEMVKGIEGLVTLPDVFIRINRLIEDPESTSADIANVVSQDPSFTARLLRVANSPFYGFSSTIDTVSRAVTLIGTNQVRSLALATSVARSFAGLPNELVSMDNFWRHSLYCALIARMLAKRTHKHDAEVVFTAGLLHDIGELVIFNRLPEQARKALELVLDSGDELPVYQAERQVMGFDHAQVGGELACQWNLPPILEECIAHHHGIAGAQRHPLEASVVHIANTLALMAEVDTLDPDDVEPIDPAAWEITGLESEEVIEPTVREAQKQIAEAEDLFIEKEAKG